MGAGEGLPFPSLCCPLYLHSASCSTPLSPSPKPVCLLWSGAYFPLPTADHPRCPKSGVCPEHLLLCLEAWGVETTGCRERADSLGSPGVATLQ